MLCYPFPFKDYMELVDSCKGEFLHLEACWDKVLTLDHIQRRGWMLFNRCALCKELRVH